MSTPMDLDECRRIEPLLDDLVDGRLSAAEQQRVEAHLAGCRGVAGCKDCGEALASLKHLLRQVDELPRSWPPASDLWPGIEPRLTERRFAERRSAAQRLGERRAGAVRWHWLRQAAAAVILMALGGVLSQLLLPAGRGQAPAPVAEALAGGPEAELALAEARLVLAEADFLRAKEALWSAVYSSHDAASPETREVVERNLAVIAAAIRELRAALEADPGNPQLEGLLLAQHRSEIGLLQRLARSAEI